MEREGPMWRRDWPDGEEARRAVRLEDSVLDSVRRAESLELRTAVDSVERFLAHSLFCSIDSLGSWLVLLSVLMLV